jgi:hypothetical protein
MTLRQLLHGLLWLAVLYAICGTTGDPDLWGHVRFGQDMLAERSIKLPDTYSFTTDRAWINHEWLSEILFAAAFNAAGAAGVNLLRILVVAGLLAIVWGASAGLVEPRRSMVVGACALGIYMRAHPIRPQVFSLLMFAIPLLLVERADQKRSLRPIIWVPPLMAAWVNFHGGWIVGFGFFALWCVPAALTRSMRGRVALAGAVTAAFAFTLLNPYGPDMWQFLWTTVRFERPMIADWQPLYQLRPLLWMSWLTGFCVAAAAAARARSRADWTSVAMVAALGLAAVRVSRLDAFFALAAVFLAIRLLCHSSSSRTSEVPRRVLPSPAIAVLFALCVLATAVALVPRATTVPVPDCLMPDSAVAAYVRDRKLTGNVLMWFDWGQYSIWHFGPDLKVSMDGRRETVYGDELISAHVRFYFGRSDEWRYAESLNADYVWIPRHLPAARALQLNGWNTLCEGQSSILLARKAPARKCEPRAPVNGRSFPQL